MNFGSLFGNKPAATQPGTTGLRPNDFALQMTGPGASVAPRAAPIGFGPSSHTFGAQTAGLDQYGTNMPTPITPEPSPAADPWGSMGPLGQFFRQIDQMRTQNGMPSMADNQKFMDMLNNTMNRRAGGFTDTGSGN